MVLEMHISTNSIFNMSPETGQILHWLKLDIVQVTGAKKLDQLI